MAGQAWYELKDPGGVVSPALLVYPDRIRHNIDEMIRIAGDAERLRPHVKTHKCPEIVKMQLEAGIRRFKCATIAEAEMLAMTGAGDVLLAYPLHGPNASRFARLQEAYPETRFAALIDNQNTLIRLAETAQAGQAPFRLYLDLDTGMGRTGIPPGEDAYELYRLLCHTTGLEPGGLHAYDGHIRHTDLKRRTEASDKAFEAVKDLRERLESSGCPVPEVVAGGSPTFPVHARRNGVRLSPGTTLLWDARYAELFPDMDFLPAAVLLCRVISKPGPDTLCLDLGHKAIAPEMDFPRVALMGLEDCKQTGQSEEHLVLSCPSASKEIGEVCYGIPMHICPTVAKYPELLVVKDHAVAGSWKVLARDYKLNI